MILNTILCQNKTFLMKYPIFLFGVLDHSILSYYSIFAITL